MRSPSATTDPLLGGVRSALVRPFPFHRSYRTSTIGGSLKGCVERYSSYSLVWFVNLRFMIAPPPTPRQAGFLAKITSSFPGAFSLLLCRRRFFLIDRPKGPSRPRRRPSFPGVSFFPKSAAAAPARRGRAGTAAVFARIRTKRGHSNSRRDYIQRGASSAPLFHAQVV